MQLIRGQHNFQHHFSGSVVTIGNFDGLHLGHQALINKVVDQAKSLHLPSVVITFEPHPREFFAGREVVPRLMRLREKCIGLKKLNIDYVYCLKFNEPLMKLSAEQFIQQILIDNLHVKHVVVGDDFKFGSRRVGDYDLLQKLSKTYNFTCEHLPTLLYKNERISSSLVRDALEHDNLALAAKLLKNPYSLCGRIVHGNQLGRKLGFPTANLYLHRELTPLKGVFVVRVNGIDNKSYYGAANLGTRPAVKGTRVLLEVYIFDFNQDIYGRSIQVEFLHKLRDEQNYDSLEALRTAITEDVKQAKTYATNYESMKSHD